MIRLTPREAEFLSYLTGLGPVGEWVYAPLEWFREDLGLGHRSRRSQLMRRLMEKGCLRFFGPENFKVLRRVEDRQVRIVNMQGKR